MMTTDEMRAHWCQDHATPLPWTREIEQFGRRLLDAAANERDQLRADLQLEQHRSTDAQTRYRQQMLRATELVSETERLRAELERLKAEQDLVAHPSGWRLVPDDPTEAMRVAYRWR